ncbi:MAG: GntR family transcriptional regulator [Planctomycetota bacterium]|jgi:GntR family transcriptional regulator
MALWIQISSGSKKPIYFQVVEQISALIARGQLRTGDRLPAVRALAAELVINPNTVARAYTVLEQSGLVTTKTGSGTFVSDPKLRRGDAADINILAERMDTLITRAVNLGLDRGKLVALFEKRLEKFAGRLDRGKQENG